MNELEQYLMQLEHDTEPEKGDQLIPATPEMQELVKQYLAAKSAMDAAKATCDELKSSICAGIGDSDGFLLSDVIVTFKVARPSKAVDWQALAMSFDPTVQQVEKHVIYKPGSRRFLTKKRKPQ